MDVDLFLHLWELRSSRVYSRPVGDLIYKLINYFKNVCNSKGKKNYRIKV